VWVLLVEVLDRAIQSVQCMSGWMCRESRVKSGMPFVELKVVIVIGIGIVIVLRRVQLDAQYSVV
jgi:hypothetical protein